MKHADGDGFDGPGYFDTLGGSMTESAADDNRTLHRTDSMDFYDCMEVIYFDDMLLQQQRHDSSQASLELQSSSSLSSADDVEDEGGPLLQENSSSSIEEDPNGDEDNSIVLGLRSRVRRNSKRLHGKLHKLAHEKRKALESTIRSRRRRLRSIMRSKDFVLTMDKLSFVFGILFIMIIEGVLLLAPQQMGALYTMLLVPLMVTRYILYRFDQYHYFMYDFCYFAQVLLLIYMYKYPHNIELGKAVFSISNGPLCMAIVMWRNSLVFHSLDKMTSMFIHILPSLVMFSIRWGDHLAEKSFPICETMNGTVLDNMREFWWSPFAYYALWQSIYLIKTEVVSKKKLEYNTEIMTSLRWMTRKKDSASYKLLSSFGERRQLPTFVLIQAAYTIVTFLCVPLLWHSIWLHTVYLSVVFVVALVNGATYYFHVFAKRYIQEIGKIVAEDRVDNSDSNKSTTKV